MKLADLCLRAAEMAGTYYAALESDGGPRLPLKRPPKPAQLIHWPVVIQPQGDAWVVAFEYRVGPTDEWFLFQAEVERRAMHVLRTLVEDTSVGIAAARLGVAYETVRRTLERDRPYRGLVDQTGVVQGVTFMWFDRPLQDDEPIPTMTRGQALSIPVREGDRWDSSRWQGEPV